MKYVKHSHISVTLNLTWI